MKKFIKDFINFVKFGALIIFIVVGVLVAAGFVVHILNSLMSMV